MSAGLIYAATGCLLFVLGLGGVLLLKALLRRVAHAGLAAFSAWRVTFRLLTTLCSPDPCLARAGPRLLPIGQSDCAGRAKASCNPLQARGEP